jgi:hypothetical protein
MNIKEAKEQIKGAVRAYLSKDEEGEWRIPVVAQRPLLLMGPPGIGKTAIIRQVAQECGVACVAYTITHHTRQSAIGLPSIQTGSFQGQSFQITEYTMSEIVASVYQEMERTGLQQGILFLDEINCVSETLAPAMLQFLQGKTFGNHQVPEGWVVVTAGNPPEYNRSVKEFDIVTLDRVRKIDISADYPAWKEYAYQRRVHPAILSYLDIKPKHFYRVETTVDGKRFVTARGWEDLSQLLNACEALSLPISQAEIAQYLQYPTIAQDFSNYLELYRKYRTDYNVTDILAGHITEATVQRLRTAPFDERLSALSLLLDAIFTACGKSNQEDAYVTELHGCLRGLIGALSDAQQPLAPFDALVEERRAQLQAATRSELLSKETRQLLRRVLQTLEDYRQTILTQNARTGQEAAQLVREQFSQAVASRKASILDTSAKLDAAFAFLETTFGEGQELVIFLTELTMNCYSMRFIRDNGCPKYTEYNESLLLGGRQKRLLEEL